VITSSSVTLQLISSDSWANYCYLEHLLMVKKLTYLSHDTKWKLVPLPKPTDTAVSLHLTLQRGLHLWTLWKMFKIVNDFLSKVLRYNLSKALSWLWASLDIDNQVLLDINFWLTLFQLRVFWAFRLSFENVHDLSNLTLYSLMHKR